MSNKPITQQLDEMETKLVETEVAASYGKGFVEDALKVMIPIFRDQVKIMREIVDEVEKKETM